MRRFSHRYFVFLFAAAFAFGVPSATMAAEPQGQTQAQAQAQAQGQSQPQSQTQGQSDGQGEGEPQLQSQTQGQSQAQGQDVLTIAAPSSIELGIFPVMLPLGVTPDVIQTGIDCGMADMCGLDPCLCGSPDAWGACACNGTRETRPAVEVAVIDSGVARVVRIGDGWWIVPLDTGTTSAEVTASLVHHHPASVSINLNVIALMPPSLVWGIFALLVVALAAFTALRIKKWALARRSSVHEQSADDSKE